MLPHLHRLAVFSCMLLNWLPILLIHSFIYSFIQAISIAPLQVHYYSEALPTQHAPHRHWTSVFNDFCLNGDRLNLTSWPPLLYFLARKSKGSLLADGILSDTSSLDLSLLVAVCLPGIITGERKTGANNAAWKQIESCPNTIWLLRTVDEISSVLYRWSRMAWPEISACAACTFCLLAGMQRDLDVLIWSYRAAVLNLMRLTDHLVNFVLVYGPPLKIVPLAHCGWPTKPYYASL